MSSNLYESTAAFALKESIKQRAREDKQVRLDACWNLVLELYDKGERDFSPTKMGKALEIRKIQRSQSYRNTQGKDYRDIVDAFASEMGARSTTVRYRSSTPLEEALKSIQDLDVQVRVRSMVDDLSRLRAENNFLRHEMSRMRRVGSFEKNDVDLREVAPAGASGSTQLKHLSPRSSLLTFLQDDWMQAHSLTIDPTGAVLCAGRSITLPGFVRQLTLLLAGVGSGDR